MKIMVKYVTCLTQERLIIGVLGVVAFAAFSGLYALSKDGMPQISRLAISLDDNINDDKAQACSLLTLSDASAENQNAQQFISCAGFLE